MRLALVIAVAFIAFDLLCGKIVGDYIAQIDNDLWTQISDAVSKATNN